MKEAVIGQILFFGASILFGAGLLMIYDVIRGFRRAWIHKSFLVILEDLIFWMFVGIAGFVFLCRYNQGQPRGFFFFGLILGMAVYYRKGSRCVLKVSTLLFGKLRHILGVGFRLANRPAGRIKRNVKWKLKKERQSVKMVLKRGSKRGGFHEKKEKK